MPAPIPTLGYRSRTEACLALREQGMSEAAIAARIGIEKKNVAALLCGALVKRRPRPAERHGRTVLFPRDILESLRPHAQARGISANELVRRIVEAVADDGLIDAVLDDGGAR